MADATIAETPPTMGTQTSAENTETGTTTTAADGDGDHPDGPVIRRQVEFYFSDENLPNDLHLLQCCGGRENMPVSISRICGFKKMRKFKKKVVSQELRKSAFLDVSDDGKTVKRKVPLAGKCLLDPPDEAADADATIAYDPRTKREVQLPVQLLPQKKAELPPGMTKGMMKPSGFEETYVESPLRPEEAAEEEAMYDPDKSLIERIEIAIQRFKQNRRMHEMYHKIFEKWMRFGGVDASSRVFGSLSKSDMAEMNAEEIARAKATHSVPWDRQDEKQWVVDFTGVAEAFLSSVYPSTYGHAPAGVKIACQVLRTFYNYLLFHNVCNEYREDLIDARRVCDKAEFELLKTYTAGLNLPGAFNVAASTIFGGSQAGTFIGDSLWAQDLISGIGMRDEEARVTFLVGVTAQGSDEQWALINRGLSNIQVVSDETIDLEIVCIQLSTDDTKEVYNVQNKKNKTKLDLQPLGKMICKARNIDNFSEYDLPKDKYPKGKLPKADENKTYEFWVEDNVLVELFEGMKLNGRVRILEDGITLLDSVRETMCSFYKWLPNELWMERHPKEVRFIRKGLEGLDEEVVEVDGDEMEGKELDSDDE
ncbi:hypothetical protein K504DRAFT_468130 [Pleomassaria siparia CBS 279.74]|uniref:HTH La-type RNA-binding domain-containing protein n=1 Tax=Pleomassaria siparia CBS 279.74 TaxID=1314801 RepID=A0A6G1K8P3_9PLEO|nr:hypothetical protein K504DRAFT_468130 [Pleomassaria siparia CBS 279.74]